MHLSNSTFFSVSYSSAYDCSQARKKSNKHTSYNPFHPVHYYSFQCLNLSRHYTLKAKPCARQSEAMEIYCIGITETEMFEKV